MGGGGGVGGRQHKRFSQQWGLGEGFWSIFWVYTLDFTHVLFWFPPTATPIPLIWAKWIHYPQNGSIDRPLGWAVGQWGVHPSTTNLKSRSTDPTNGQPVISVHMVSPIWRVLNLFLALVCPNS